MKQQYLIATSLIMTAEAYSAGGVLIPRKAIGPGRIHRSEFEDHPGLVKAVDRAVRKGGAHWEHSAPVVQTQEPAIINLPASGEGDQEHEHAVITATTGEVRKGLHRSGDKPAIPASV